MTQAAWRREAPGELVLMLQVQPGARRSEVAGVYGEGENARLKLRLAARAVEGQANAELARFLAETFAVALRNVTLVHGETSRRKTVRITRPARRPDLDWH